MPRRGLVFSWLLSAIAAVPICSAQSPVGARLEYGTTLQVPSRILGETRPVDVSLPAGYDEQADRRYPLLIVLDGESQHQVAAAMTRFFATVGQLPGMVVVGVRNTDRTRDLSPAPVGDFQPPRGLGDTFGGADRFLDFLERELIPDLERAYRIVPVRVLVGHSIGGTFVLHALASRPGLFTGALVMDPASWWNNQHELVRAREALRRPELRRARVVAVNTPWLEADTTAWGDRAPLVRQFDTPGETHISMPVPGLMRGLRLMFADFVPGSWRPGSRPIAMIARLDSLSDRLGYDVPIPARTWELVARMSLDSRFFDDAETVLNRMEQTIGLTPTARGFRERLERDRGTAPPPGFVPLVIPERRPTPQDAAPFLGRWERVGTEDGELVLEFRASGDTVTAWSRAVFERNGQPFEEYWPMIQLTSDGTLEVGAPWLRGIAGLVVFQCRIQPDGTLRAERQVRGFAPPGNSRGPWGPVVFRRVGE